MKRLVCALLSLMIILLLLTSCSKNEEFVVCPANAGDVSIVSFNVAAPWGSLTNNTLSASRVKRFALYMNAVKPDSIGTQEMNSIWMEKLGELMPDYDSYGVIRGGDDNEKKSEMNSIFWLKDKYNCVDKGTFWLSTTPDTESKYDGAGCNRVCSYVVLKDKESNMQYIHMNTHLDNASEQARSFGADVIMDRIAQLEKQYPNIPIVLSGDFNEYLSDPACQQILTKLNTKAVSGNTYHDWGSINEGEPIDFIFTTGEVVESSMLNDVTNGLVSDHYGVWEIINL